MMAGHTLLKILLSFVFLALFSDFIQFFFGIGGLICISTILMLDFVVAVLQVFVFVTLSLFYITDTHNVNH
jgi:F0F1-type ATP synthase membrane subunit a